MNLSFGAAKSTSQASVPATVAQGSYLMNRIDFSGQNWVEVGSDTWQRKKDA